MNQHPKNLGELEEYIEVISEHQLNCERQGKYVEAELAKNKVKDLKDELARKKKDEVRIRHLNDKQGVERAHLEEFNNFNQFWDQKMLEFEDESLATENELIERHHAEYSSVQEELEKVIPYKPKQSSEALNLVKIEESLARQKKYNFSSLILIFISFFLIFFYAVFHNQLIGSYISILNQTKGVKLQTFLNQNPHLLLLRNQFYFKKMRLKSPKL